MKSYQDFVRQGQIEFKTHQQKGVDWCIRREIREWQGVRGGFIADEMGLGKTIIVLGLMYCNPLRKTLLVVPPILLEQWKQQIMRICGKMPLVFHGHMKRRLYLENLQDLTVNVVLTTYGSLCNFSILQRMYWDRVVFDEAHHLKSSKTATYEGAKKLNVGIKWLVSGTPVQNSAQEYWNLLSFLGVPKMFFEVEYLDFLRQKFILRRTKADVGILMPKLTVERTDVSIDRELERTMLQQIHATISFRKRLVKPRHQLKYLDEEFLEKKQEKDLDIDLKKRAKKELKHMGYLKRQHPLKRLLVARQSCILPAMTGHHLQTTFEEMKSDLARRIIFQNDVQDLDDVILEEENSLRAMIMANFNGKLVRIAAAILARQTNNRGKLVFCTYHTEADQMQQLLQLGGMTHVVKFDGRVSAAERAAILADQTIQALIIQIQSGCEGLNLQENYSEVFFIAPHWNPAVEDQAIARCHRLGQRNPVYVEKFYLDEIEDGMKNLDNYIYEMQELKRAMARSILDGDAVSDSESSDSSDSDDSDEFIEEKVEIKKEKVVGPIYKDIVKEEEEIRYYYA